MANKATEALCAALRQWRVRGITLYLRDPGVGSRYWHYRGHRPLLISGRWCRWIGHSWHHWEAGFVYGGGFADAFKTCERDGCEARSR